MSTPAVVPLTSFPESDNKSVLLKVPEVSVRPVESDTSECDSASDGETSSTISTVESDSGVSDKHLLAIRKKLAKGIASISTPNNELEQSYTAAPHDDIKPVEENKPVEDVEVAYDGKKRPTPRTVADICQDIVRVLARYRLVHQNDTSNKWGAKAKFLAQVERYVVRGEAISMSLPAFPFKSPNKQAKVLGTLPDKGEEVALSHLEGLCRAIGDVYEPGANVYIVSDGLMYNGKDLRPKVLSNH